jgi:TRAP-type C4-dicarboxylate transport system substrate-binding protein
MNLKRKGILILVTAMLLSFIMAGCGGTDSGSATGNANSSSTGSTASSDNTTSEAPIELIFQCHDPVNSTAGIFLQQWCDTVNEQSNGKLNITFYGGGVLGGQKDTYDMILNGTADIGWCSQNSQQGAFPMTEVFTLPLLGFESGLQSSRALWNLFEQTDYLDEEYAPFHMIAVHTYCDITLGFRDKNVQINSAADLKNKTVRTSGNWITKFYTNLGANPATISAGEVYSSLEKGTLDAISADWHLIKSFSLVEQLPVFYDLQLLYGPDYILMNKDSYDRLPDDCKAVIDANSGLVIAEAAANEWADNRDICLDQIKEKGFEIRTPSGTLVNDLQKAADELQVQWVTENEANGYPAQEVLDWVRNNMDSFK